MEEPKEKPWDAEIIELCPILYSGKKKPATESLMCLGFECGKGWSQPLMKMSCRLEELNMRYWPKYRVRIEMVQVKEKYGTLCAYNDIRTDGNGILWMLHNAFYRLYDKIRHIDYRTKQILDRDVWTEHEIKELSKVEWLKEKHRCTNVCNVSFREENGKYIRQTDLEHHREFHYEPTRLKFMKKVERLVYKLACMTDNWASSHTNEQTVIIEAMQHEAEKIVREAEHDCESVCEHCGHTIGTKWSPTCETTGWVSFLCHDCAKQGNSNYMMNDELWNGNVRIKTKEELKNEREEANKKYEERRKAYKEAERKFEEELKQVEAEEKSEHQKCEADQRVS